MGNYYIERGRFFDAESVLLRCLAIQRKVLKPEDTNLARSVLLLAEVYFWQGRLSEVELLSKEIIRSAPQDEQNAYSFLRWWGISQLGRVYWMEDRDAEAEPLLRQAAEFFESSMINPNLVALTVWPLGDLYCREQRFADAKTLAMSAQKAASSFPSGLMFALAVQLEADAYYGDGNSLRGSQSIQ